MQYCHLFQLMFGTGVCPISTAVWLLVTFSVTSGNSLTDSDLQLLIETEHDQTRHSFIQYYITLFFAKVHVTRDIFAHNIAVKRQKDIAIFETYNLMSNQSKLTQHTMCCVLLRAYLTRFILYDCPEMHSRLSEWKGFYKT